MNGVGNIKQLTENDIQIINNWFATESRLFRNATVGNHIATGGQAIVNYLVYNDSTEFVVKVLYAKDNSDEERNILEKSFYKLKDTNDSIVEVGFESKILRVLESFSIKVGNNEYLRGFVEKYTECLEKHEHNIEKNARKQKYTEIAFRIGFDLLPLLQCFIDLADPKTGGAIYHRDIKPANIFLKNKNVSDGLCLGDFGIATHSNSKRKPTTTKRIAAGTEHTMTHDIIMQNSKDTEFEDIDKSDMFSLGVTMYYYLNGGNYPFVSPFEKPEDVFAWLEERKKGCSKTLPFGSDELKNIVYKAIEFYPKDRFKSCNEMFEALKNTPEYEEFVVNTPFKEKPKKYDVPESSKEKELKKRCKILISIILLSVIIAFGSFFVILNRDIIPYIEETRSGTVVDAVDSSQYNLLEGTDDEIS